MCPSAIFDKSEILTSQQNKNYKNLKKTNLRKIEKLNKLNKLKNHFRSKRQ